MFKFGVYRLDQYRDGSPFTLADALRGQPSQHRISFQLFRTDLPASPKQVSLFEHTMPQMMLSNGVYRTSYRGRFRGLDIVVNALLGKLFDTSAALQFQDWAASDCLTSTEWASSLLAQFPNANLTASDSTLFLIEAALPNGEVFIMEANGEPMQYIRPPFVIRMNPPEPRMLAVNWLLAKHARSRLRALRSAWNLSPEWLGSEGGGDLEQAPFVFRKISLIHPEAQALRCSSGRFAIRRHSVFEAWLESCHAIRTMNIFNPAYFPADRLLEGARAVWHSLVHGGIWIVGRTVQENPPVNNVSILVKAERGFQLLDQYGQGSEIERLVLANGTSWGAHGTTG